MYGWVIYISISGEWLLRKQRRGIDYSCRKVSYKRKQNKVRMEIEGELEARFLL